MSNSLIFKLGSATISFCLISVISQSAQAGTLHNGWNYAIDPNYDSLDSNNSGGVVAGNTIYEIYGMAIKDDVDTNNIWVAINANLPLTGNNTSSASNGNIGWGDLFFDFSGLGNFQAANNSQNVIGVRFAPNNDSQTPGIGVYGGVKAVSVVPQNYGWSNLANHNLYGVLPRTGANAAMGDLAWNDPYYNPYTTIGAWSQPETLIPNVIQSGTKIGDISLLNNSDLTAAGLDLGVLPATGSQTFGFKFDKSLLPVGNFIASLILECNNDATALVGETKTVKPVPEPSATIGLAAFGLIFGANQLRKRNKA
ncbi:XDD3 family exosortase-dependent surface protein [Limnofasciculus baicalensis]|uniref:PEP-CTERM sorting domain-containing protein n=1 Tax=Limnofasciculus baicalensis BBK-W-15 TaxID=2699891 RepID=A0AAE3KR92_9CYAN|nr:XDD3 family exosortase-dependent surface protein [Limnofasciculus baicalensis]MCP2728162.1 PEP-CTERM sorting domain-containing protein [Limnofasciculus baicalensis BBK-W-15]